LDDIESLISALERAGYKWAKPRVVFTYRVGHIATVPLFELISPSRCCNLWLDVWRLMIIVLSVIHMDDANIVGANGNLFGRVAIYK
jgi:hypothetical protein